MYFSGNQLLLYAVTDRGWLKPGETLAQQVENALKGGVTMVQLREKDLSREQFLQQAREILPLCRRFGVPLIINDDVQLALEVGADGVHIGQEDMAYEKARQLLGPNKIIGVSAHNPQEALQAQKAGADYLGCGAVFGSSTKEGVQTLTPAGLKAICEAVEIPVVAIGGISEKNLEQLKGCGAYGAAVVSAIFAKENKEEAARHLSTMAESVFGFHSHGMKTALTIAGSDSSGGAGIQADMKTMAAHGVYAMSAITALTAQNTTGVYGVMESTPEFLKKQLDCVFTDIFPDAVKIGMVSSAPLIHTIAEALKEYRPHNIVLDPVMVSTSGSRLLAENASQALLTELAPLADMITPNIPEGEVLSGTKIRSKQDMVQAARIISEKFSGAILLKGGHLADTSDDLLYVDGQSHWFTGRHIPNPNTHGTGCTLSSAIASCLALGFSLPESVQRAKNYVAGALFDGLDLGHGSGPLNHGYRNIK